MGRRAGDAGLNEVVAGVLGVWGSEMGPYDFGRAKRELKPLHGLHSKDTILAHLQECFRQNPRPDQRKYITLPGFVSRFNLYAPAGSVPDADGSEARYRFLADEARRGMDMSKYEDWPKYLARYMGRKEVASGSL
jgi:hypothetical protein